jgi:predicted RecA/RadA family phage recombinase
MLNLNARFNLKLNATDTVSLSNRINLKLNQTDTINLSNRIDLKLNKSDTISLSNRIDIKLNPSDTVSLSNRINKKLDTIYIQYQNYLDTIVNKDTINISNTLTEGFGINIIADSINIDSAVILTTQQKQIAYVKNESGVTMYKGQAVYSSGSSGTNKLVTLASSSTEQTSSKTFGVVESESIPNGSHGYIITFGLLDKINTDNLTEGSSVYLSSTPGQLTTTKPQAPLHLVTIGVCIRRQQNNGSIFVKIQNGFELDELHDVRITSPVDNASLYYKLSEQLWRDTTATLLVSDTASMLSKYVNTYSNQTNINGDKTFNNTVTIDSATVTGKLLVNTNISDAVKITSNTNSTNLELMNNSGTVYIKSSNKNMILQTDTTALVYLNGNNKKVGILTMNPQQELQVAGNVRIDSLNNNLVPTNLVGSSNNNDLTNVHLGQ